MPLPGKDESNYCDGMEQAYPIIWWESRCGHSGFLPVVAVREARGSGLRDEVLGDKLWVLLLQTRGGRQDG